jgi:biopolymer transport protein ExbD
MNKPTINVTPLIDVLLVLLIIFMVSAPLRPRSLRARIPAEPDSRADVRTNPETLVVQLNSDGSLKLNREAVDGSVTDTSGISRKLEDVFAARSKNGSIAPSAADDAGRPFPDKIERTVFVKAGTTMPYGSVARVVDAVKAAGAYPISLQIDGLDR